MTVLKKWQADHNCVGKPQGKWSYYDRSGKLVKEDFYKDGELIDTRKY